MKHMLTKAGRIIIPKKGLSKNDAFKSILKVQDIEMSDAEQAIVDKYLNGSATLEETQKQLMDLPVE